MLLRAAIVDVHSVPAAAVKDEELAMTVTEEELTAALLELMEELEIETLLELMEELETAILLELFAELLLLAEEELVVTELELATVLDRRDFGITAAQGPVGNEVEIVINIEAGLTKTVK